MNPRRKKRLSVVIFLLVGLSLVIGLVLYSLGNSIDVFYKPSEIHLGLEKSGAKPLDGQRLRIGGIVVPGSVKRDPDSLAVQFDLVDMKTPLVFSDDDITVTVKYNGILPDLFREKQGIVANGVLQSNNEIVATEVLAKHDENYMPKEISEQSGKSSGY